MDKDIDKWIHTQAGNLKYGEITVTLVIHDGRIQRMICNVSESVKHE